MVENSRSRDRKYSGRQESLAPQAWLICAISTLVFAATGKNDYSDDVQSIQKTYELFT